MTYEIQTRDHYNQWSNELGDPNTWATVADAESAIESLRDVFPDEWHWSESDGDFVRTATDYRVVEISN